MTENNSSANSDGGSFFVRTAEGDRLVNTMRVAYLQAQNRWCEIVRLDGVRYVARHSLKEIETRLPGVFQRLDRCHLVNTVKMDRVLRISRNESVVEFEEGSVFLKTGRAGMAQLRKWKLSLFKQSS